MGPATHQTGSVYLDTPARPSRRPPVPRVNETRVRAASLLGVVGLVALTAATLLAGVRSLLLDPDPYVDAFEVALDDETTRAELERELATNITDDLIGPELTESAAAFGVDVPAEAERVAGVVLDDPAVRVALADLVVEIHELALVDPEAAEIDLTGLTAAAVAAIELESPTLAGLIPPGATLWTFDPATVPDLSLATGVTDRVGLLALAAALLLPAAAVVHPRHHRVADWIGRWALGIAAICAIAAVGLPFVGRELSGLQTVEAMVRATSLRLLGPAGVAGIVGVGLVAVAAVARRREKQRVLDEGAAAALGYDEPPLWAQASSPQLDLARRGLVDAGQRLTNI